MKKLIQEFKDFAIKGNALELATAVVIGGAFGKIVTSLVSDIIMPVAGFFTGGGSFSDWKIVLKQASAVKPAIIMNIGMFIQNVIDFLIIAASVFLMVKLVTKFKRKKKEEKKEEPKITKDQELLMEIRDLLKK